MKSTTSSTTKKPSARVELCKRVFDAMGQDVFARTLTADKLSDCVERALALPAELLQRYWQENQRAILRDELSASWKQGKSILQEHKRIEFEPLFKDFQSESKTPYPDTAAPLDATMLGPIVEEAEQERDEIEEHVRLLDSTMKMNFECTMEELEEKRALLAKNYEACGAKLAELDEQIKWLKSIRVPYGIPIMNWMRDYLNKARKAQRRSK